MEYVTDSERYEKWLLSKEYEMMKEKYNIFKKKKVYVLNQYFINVI